MLNSQRQTAAGAANRKARRAKRRNKKRNTDRNIAQAAPAHDAIAQPQQRLLKQAVEHQKAGRLGSAEKCYRQLLGTDPACMRAFLGLGVLFVSADRPDEAYEYLKQAVALKPDNVACWRTFGRCLADMGQTQAAVVAYAEAAELEPGNAELLVQLGLMLLLNGEGEEALEALDKAIVLDPNCSEAHYYRGIQQNALGDLSAACASFRRALEIDPASASSYLHLADLVRTIDEQKALISDAKRVIEAGNEEPQSLATLHFAIARVRHRQQQYDEAFSYYASANRILNAAYKLDRDSVRVMVDEIIEGFQPGVFEVLQDAAADSDLPVFIVGMPRSGSTLVEQIISSHRDVAGAGEFPKLWKLASLLNKDLGGPARYPQHVGNFSPEDLLPIGEDYLNALRHSRPDSALRITDKNLNNFFNVGLIAVLFPNAPIIHCRRDPMGTCLSCYFQDFTQVHHQLVYTNDLEDLGFFYCQYERLMAHWRAVLPGRMLEVDYEEVVTDQENISRKLIGHIGLPWDDSCLEFHKSANSAITSSLSQVRKPVYTSSVAAWRKYGTHLSPLQRALDRKW
ncbi:MAG: sulfotransferase [Methyloligellaceae bacterium]